MTTELIGREDDLAALADLMAAGEQLITITGAAGIGKSRILQALRDNLLGDKRVVVAIDASEIRDLPALFTAVAAALGLGELDATGARDQLGRVLSSRERMVLLIDNLEQVAVEAAGPVAHWCAQARETTIVIASRQRLECPDEHTYELRPLNANAALELWTRSARRARHDYRAHADGAIARRIVRALDFVPLSIELAAARMSMLGERELLDRLARPLDVLRAPTVSVEDSIAASWDLLSDHERLALSQCAVFRGGFNATAAEAVIVLPKTAPPALDVVARLRHASLIQAMDGAHGVTRRRLHLLMSVRAFVAKQLPVDPASRERHARHYLGLIDSDPRTDAAIVTVGDEYDNLVAIAERGLAADTVDGLEDALSALRVLNYPQGRRYPSVGIRRLVDRALHSRFHRRRRAGEPRVCPASESSCLVRSRRSKRRDSTCRACAPARARLRGSIATGTRNGLARPDRACVGRNARTRAPRRSARRNQALR